MNKSQFDTLFYRMHSLPKWGIKDPGTREGVRQSLFNAFRTVDTDLFEQAIKHLEISSTYFPAFSEFYAALRIVREKESVIREERELRRFQEKPKTLEEIEQTKKIFEWSKKEADRKLGIDLFKKRDQRKEKKLQSHCL